MHIRERETEFLVIHAHFYSNDEERFARDFSTEPGISRGGISTHVKGKVTS